MSNRHGSTRVYIGAKANLSVNPSLRTSCRRYAPHRRMIPMVTRGAGCAARRRPSGRPHGLALLPHAVDALDPDRRHALALRADRALAALAAYVGHTVRVPRADRDARAVRGRLPAGRRCHPCSMVTRSITTGSSGRSRRVGRPWRRSRRRPRGVVVGDLAEDGVLALQVRRREPP